MLRFKNLLAFIACLLSIRVAAQGSFKIVPLGVLGGADESNMSAYMLAPTGSDHYICLDAGTLRAGIQKAIDNKTFNAPAEHILRQYIKGYFISHSHLDHLAGMVINAPDDTAKTIYGLANCIKILQTHYFTWESWANFTDAGEAPALKKFHYEVLTPGKEVPVQNTDMLVKAFPLSHSNLTSTAFLVKNNNNYVLYLGDTGADATEKSTHMHQLWEAIAPLVKNKSLKAIMIETSFPNEVPDKSLFGHFTPHWLMNEFDNLEALTGAGSLKGLNVIVTHLKLPYSNIVKIKQQLKAENKLQLNLIYPEQGKQINL